MLRILTILSLCATLAGSVQSGATLPVSVLEAAQQSPTDFAAALAAASVPAGFEIKEADDGPPMGVPAGGVDFDRRVSVADVAKAFEARHPGYRARMRGGALVIRPIEGALAFMDEPSTIYPRVTVKGVMNAARRVFLPLDPRLSGSALNSLGRKSDEIPVALDGSGGRTVTDTLNQIVTQAPDRAWVVTTREKAGAVRIVGFGFIEADGSRRVQPISE